MKDVSEVIKGRTAKIEEIDGKLKIVLRKGCSSIYVENNELVERTDLACKCKSDTAREELNRKTEERKKKQESEKEAGAGDEEDT